MLIIDGTYLIYKSYYRTKKIEGNFEISSNIHFSKIARNMFLKLLSNIKTKFNPSELFIVFDCEGDNFRHQLLPSYKSNRKEKPIELADIKQEVYNFLTLHKFPFQVADNVEGDDLIASFVHQHPNKKISIFTGDGDMGALVNNNVTLLLEKKKKILEVTATNFHHFFPVPPTKLADFKALQGDKSDFVKGVDGLFRGETIHLLIDFDSIEDYLEKGKEHYLFNKINKIRDKVLINKAVTSMKKDCNLKITTEFTKVSNISLPHKIASKVGWFKENNS